ncbi:MAG: helix-turn-helix domain-containing protein [Cyanobacteria bacterium J06635_1]
MPTPKAPPIYLSEQQHQCLSQIARQTTHPYRLVRRANIILLAASGESNSRISRQWQLDRNQVRYWRQRWLEDQERLSMCEQADERGEALHKQVLATLSDEQRPGVPPSFTPEQVVQIVAIACEAPSASDRPVNDWTLEEIADEAVKRGIVSSISPSSGKDSGSQSPSGSKEGAGQP